MAREIDKLTALEVKSLTRPGRHGDGNGLYLEIGEDGSKRWLFRYQLNGRRRDMGLGPVTKANGLAEARRQRDAAQDLIAKGVDPIDARKRPSSVPTFAEHAETLIADLKPGWRGAKTEASWKRSLLTHAKKIGAKPVDEVTTEDVLSVVRPIWSKMPESAGKLRERIERVLDSARAAGMIEARDWANPARWKGHLAHMLPKRQKLTRGHFAALHYDDLPGFMDRLHQQESMGARALEFTVYTVAREGMTIGADWKEIKGPVWRVPGSRMKDGKDFDIHLSAEALEVLKRVSGAGRSGYIFKGSKRGSHISNATMDAVLDRMDLEVTVHGFRATFRDWAGDKTTHAREVIEHCLAHKVGDAVERAYRRSDAQQKRAAVLDDYAAFAASAIRRRTKA